MTKKHFDNMHQDKMKQTPHAKVSTTEILKVYITAMIYWNKLVIFNHFKLLNQVMHTFSTSSIQRLVMVKALEPNQQSQYNYNHAQKMSVSF